MAASITLFEILEKAGSRVHAYDLGRRIGAIGRAAFVAFERAETPYPTPLQRKAVFALAQTPATNAGDPLIWFLRLDLDEQGLLVPAARDYLLDRLLEAARAQSQGIDPRAFLRDNPYAFHPREERMALFHAVLSRDLGLAPSRFYEHALAYFHGELGWDQWGFVGYQGIADVATRHADAPLATAIPQLPEPPLIALGHCLESGGPGGALSAALVRRLDDELAARTPSPALLAALLRGLSARSGDPRVAVAIAGLLASPAAADIEVLAAMAGRAWEALDEPALLDAFLHRLAADPHGPAAFAGVVDDLLSLPSLAPVVRKRLRADDQHDSVRAAFAQMMVSSFKGSESLKIQGL